MTLTDYIQGERGNELYFARGQEISALRKLELAVIEAASQGDIKQIRNAVENLRDALEGKVWGHAEPI